MLSFFWVFVASLIGFQSGPVTDNFSGSALSSNWTVPLGAFTVASNTASPNASGAQSLAVYIGTTFSNDHSVCAPLTSYAANSYIGPSARTSSTENTAYFIESGNQGGQFQINIQKVLNGTYTNLTSFTPAVVGHNYCISAIGSAITLYDNGFASQSVNDTDIPTGAPGISGFGGNGTSIGTWSAQNGVPPAAFQVSNSTVPSSLTVPITLTGFRTSWGSGTTFTLSGISGASVTSTTCTSTTSCVVNITTGSATGTAQLTDNSSGYQVAMLIRARVFWYLRNSGGTRYDAAVHPAGQCDGQADADYPGSGVNQHCAFNDWRWFFDNQNGARSWIIQGGDVITLRGGPWRVGYDEGTAPSTTWCPQDEPIQCGNPVIPPAYPTLHTQIRGENYANCGSKSQMTQIFGGYAVTATMYLAGAKYVDIQCIELTRHSQCITHGLPAVPSVCSINYPLDDFADDGIVTNNTTSDIYMTDMWIHGFPNRGILGAIGGPVSAIRVDIAYNGFTGWDFDDGTPSPLGSLVFNQSTMEWSGCNQEYPIAHQFPLISCYGQSSQGQGDGFGTSTGFCMPVTMIGSALNYNMQEGADFGHIDTLQAGGNCNIIYMNNIALADLGETFKWGPGFNNAIFVNNISNGNCHRLADPIGDIPSTAMTNFFDYCRSAGGMSWNVAPGTTALVAYNLFTGYPVTQQVIGCNIPSGDCTTAVVTWRNNNTLGFDNPWMYANGGQAGGTAAFYCQNETNGNPVDCDTAITWVRDHNNYYGMRTTNFTCPTIYAQETCLNPLLVNQPTGNASGFVESELDWMPLGLFNGTPTSASPLVGAGVAIPGYPTDYYGTTHPNPPSIGIAEITNLILPPSQLGGSVVFGGATSIH